MLTLATRLGLRQCLRGGDALYTATAQLTRSTLISRDDELVQVAGVVTPAEWLPANP